MNVIKLLGVIAGIINVNSVHVNASKLDIVSGDCRGGLQYEKSTNYDCIELDSMGMWKFCTAWDAIPNRQEPWSGQVKWLTELEKLSKMSAIWGQ